MVVSGGGGRRDVARPTLSIFLLFFVRSTMPEATLTPLPVHAIDVSTKHVMALTGANILVYDRASGALHASLEAHIDAAPHDGPIVNVAHFPRLCAFSPSGDYVAVASDDKILRVWHVDHLAYGEEVMLQRLAKRAGTLQWTCYADHGEEVVVADKFGDVWSFPLDLTQPVISLDALAEVNADADTSVSAWQPRLGHVSMVTCLAFLGEEGHVPHTIVTCDRDEHMRLSRWGPHRAAYVVESYLLGSRSCVGALAVLPAASASQAGLPAHDKPVLITSDGGACLRVWCATAQGAYQLHATVHLTATPLLEHVTIDAGVERRREKAASNLAFQGVFDPSEPEPASKRTKRSDGQDEASSTPTSGTTLVIQRLVPYTYQNRTWLLVCVEGADAVYSVALDQLQADATDMEPVTSMVGAPVLGAALASTSDGVPELWVCCDDRAGLGCAPPVRRLVWKDDKVCITSTYTQWVMVPPPSGDVRALMDAETASETQTVDKVPQPAQGATLVAVPHTPRALGMYMNDSPCSTTSDVVQVVPVFANHDMAQAAAEQCGWLSFPELFPGTALGASRTRYGRAIPSGQTRCRACEEPAEHPTAVWCGAGHIIVTAV